MLVVIIISLVTLWTLVEVTATTLVSRYIIDRVESIDQRGEEIVPMGTCSGEDIN